MVETAPRAACTRPRRSRSLRSGSRSSASRESSGRPLVISRSLNCRVGIEMRSSASSPSSGPPNATRDSNRVRAWIASHHARRARASRPGPGGSRPLPATPSRGRGARMTRGRPRYRGEPAPRWSMFSRIADSGSQSVGAAHGHDGDRPTDRKDVPGHVPRTGNDNYQVLVAHKRDVGNHPCRAIR